jgi:sec-independent protein translocase protein TatB
MFDIGAAELLVIIVVAVVVIGPKDLPLAMRVAGRWIGKIRRVSAHFRSGIDAMVREAELEDMEKKWKAQNEEIMRRSAALTDAEANRDGDASVMTGPPPVAGPGENPPPADTLPGEATQSEHGPPPPPPPPLPLAPVTPAARIARVEVGGDANNLMPDPPREPMLPARPHTGAEDV